MRGREWPPKPIWNLVIHDKGDGEIEIRRRRVTIMSGEDERPMRYSVEERSVGTIYHQRGGGYYLARDEPPHSTLRDAIAELEDRVGYDESATRDEYGN